ncbi:MAG: VCBS repeat-containing protein, partial [Planctomycetes bacterium]|nr:VCBS repeat-containing protein [Planctomycetota bacterium]
DGMLYVVDGEGGGSQILVYDSNLVYQYRFSFADQAIEAEGIAFDTETSHLFIVVGRNHFIYEYTTTGVFVAGYDFSAFSPLPRTPQGLAFAPTSDPNDDPAARSLYIADSMRDNFEDGRIFETSLPGRVAPESGAFVGQNTISADFDGAFSLFAADIDGDGDTDVLSASFQDDTIAWHENDGSGGFTAHTISTAADEAVSVFAADLDGDGDIDVLSASMSLRVDDGIVWYENDGSEGFTAHTISSDVRGATSVYAVDLDGDGDTDVLSASYHDDKIAWYENDGSGGFTAHTIDTDADGVFSVFAADLDGDGDVDVLSASRRDDKIAWYENDGSQGFTAHTISTAADGAFSVYAADLDGDGDVDVLSASRFDDKIAWYENDGNGGFTAHTISTAARGANSVFAADVDGDGDTDVLSASFADDKIAWYEND